jgi:hypothetical protein
MPVTMADKLNCINTTPNLDFLKLIINGRELSLTGEKDQIIVHQCSASEAGSGPCSRTILGQYQEDRI